MLDSIKAALVPVHREGYRFIAIFAVISLILFWLLPDVFGWLGVLATAWCAYFFRDPPRVTPVREGLVIAPADGRVSAIEEVEVPPELDLGEERHVRISIFMNVFDVHINRSPVDAVVRRIAYIPGKFVNAELDKASEDNERQALTLRMADGTMIGVVQIAGLLARRIVRWAETGDQLVAGQRFGLIRFGSRVDVYLPQGVAAAVAVGQRAVAGETVIADLAASEGPRLGRES